MSEKEYVKIGKWELLETLQQTLFLLFKVVKIKLNDKQRLQIQRALPLIIDKAENKTELTEIEWCKEVEEKE